MKKLLLLAMVLGLLVSGCAGPHGGRGCKSTVNNWYKPDKTRWQTSKDITRCVQFSGYFCNGERFENCMTELGYIWVDGTQNPRNIK